MLTIELPIEDPEQQMLVDGDSEPAFGLVSLVEIDEDPVPPNLASQVFREGRHAAGSAGKTPSGRQKLED